MADKGLRRSCASLAAISPIIFNFMVTLLTKVNQEQNNDNHKSETIQEKLDLIQRSTAQMTHQVNDILNFSRITPLIKSRTTILSMLDNVLNRLNIPKQIQVILPKTDYEIICDVGKIEIVFLNIIQNAIEAISKRGKILLRIHDIGNDLSIEVEDSGPGLSEHEASQLFTPLFTTKYLGTGLGLVTCKSIVEQHNGKITFRLNPTTFVINLPKNNFSK